MFSPLIASNLYICEVHACNEERFDVHSCFKSTARGAAADSRTESGGPGSGFSVTWNNWKCKFSKHLKQTWNMQTCMHRHQEHKEPWKAAATLGEISGVRVITTFQIFRFYVNIELKRNRGQQIHYISIYQRIMHLEMPAIKLKSIP